jgi:cobalt-zinc-cadmium efflux system protein
MEKKKRTGSRLALAFFLNLGFSILEIFAGFATNSVAILTDSVHDAGDAVSIAIAWILDRKARKKPNRRFTYGYARYSLLGALISSVILLVGSTVVIVESVDRLLHPEAVLATEMVYVALLGILVNGIAALNASKGRSLSEKAVTLHLFEDVFGWIAVLLGAIVIRIWDVPIIDSLLSVGFTVFILFHVFQTIRSIANVFLEKAPEGIDIDKIMADLASIPHVTGIHHVHLWSLEGRIHLTTLHAVLAEGLGEEKYLLIQKELHERLKSYGLDHATIEIEYGCPSCTESEFETEGYASETEGHHHH